MKYRRIQKEMFNTSMFLLGPRQVGKSTYLKNTFPESIYIDLLNNQVYQDYILLIGNMYSQIMYNIQKNPAYKLNPIIIDEVQRIPELLNDVHRLIENEKLSFILCGSSARKLTRGGANMLGGRAGRIEMRGLSSTEIEGFDLLRFINQGGIPSIYYSENHNLLLSDYIQNYIKEEIANEALVRNLPSFNRFLELVGITNGEEVNYLSISRDVGVDSKTVREYFQIIEDTLLGSYLQPYFDIQKRTNILKSPKFYLFDTGIANNLKGISIQKAEGVEFGRSFEHIVYNEILNYKNFQRKSFDVSFWRTYEKDEIDFILGKGEIAIEVKGGKRIDSKELKSLLRFKEIYKPKQSIVVANINTPILLENGIKIVPYQEFVELLWNGDII